MDSPFPPPILHRQSPDHRSDSNLPNMTASTSTSSTAELYEKSETTLDTHLTECEREPVSDIAEEALKNAQLRASILEREVRLGICDEDNESEDESVVIITEEEANISKKMVSFVGVGFSSVYFFFRTQNTKPIMDMMKQSLKKDQLIIISWLPFMLPIDSVKHSKITFDKNVTVCLYDQYEWDVTETSYDKDAKPTKSILKKSSTFTMTENELSSNEDTTTQPKNYSWSCSLYKVAKRYAKKANDLTFGPIVAHRRATKDRCNMFVCNAVVHSAAFSK